MMKVLIGYDGSAEAAAALDDLRLAGLPHDVEARILCVGEYEVSSPVCDHLSNSKHREPGSIAYLQATWKAETTKRLAQSAAQRLRSTFRGWHVDEATVGGDAPHELISAADEWRADLLVVGAQRRSALGRLLLGSVSKWVVADADCSVRVARTWTVRNEDAPPRILVGVDGSPDSKNAVHAVGRRVWPSGTEVRFVTLDEGVSPGRFAQILPTAAAMIAEELRQSATRARNLVEWATEQLRLIGLGVSVASHRGDARRVLVAEAQSWGADAIFVGARSFGGALEQSRSGRVASGVAAEASCSVEVVRGLDVRSSAGSREQPGTASDGA